MTDNYAAEQSIIGSALIDPSCVPDVLQIVKADDFRPGMNREIFQAITRLYLSGAVVDIVTVIDETQKHSEAAGKDIERYAIEVMQLTPTAANVLEYARIVKENSQRRRIADLADEISNAAHFSEGVNDVLSTALTGFQALSDEGEAKATGGAAAVRNFRAWVDAAKKDPGHAVVRSGFYALDLMLGGGLVKTGLYVIGARPGMGKTTVALNLASHIAAAGKRVLFVSLEMSEIQITTKRVSMWTGLPFSAIYNGRISEDDEERILPALEPLLQRNHSSRLHLAADDFLGQRILNVALDGAF